MVVPLVITPSPLLSTPSRRTPSRSNPNPNPNPKQAQRLTFDSSSPNGILLFRDASAIVVAYGRRVLEYSLPSGADPYRYKHKGISLCMLLLTRALSGNYVNFGVFALYGDRALSDCLQVTINLCLCISLEEIMSYPKVSKCYFTLDHELTPTLTLKP